MELNRRLGLPHDEQEILKLFTDGDRALIAADIAELTRIFADDYIQYDESGNVFTKCDVIRNLQTGSVRFLSMVSTARNIRTLTESVAIVHGSEEDEVGTKNGRSNVSYVYTDVVIKRDGRWQITASQLAKPPSP